MSRSNPTALCISAALARIRELDLPLDTSEDQYDPIDGLFRALGRHHGNRLFSKVLREILTAANGWTRSIRSLTLMQNFKINKLIVECDHHGAYLRKPVAFLEINITTRDNLVMDWFPNVNGQTDLGDGDFISCTSSPCQSWPKAGNRIFIIRQFNDLLETTCDHEYIINDPDLASNRLLLKATQVLIDKIHRHISEYCDPHLINSIDWLRLDDGKPFSSELVGLKINHGDIFTHNVEGL